MIRAYPEKIDPANGGWDRPDIQFHVRPSFIVVVEAAGGNEYENEWSKITLANDRVGYVPMSPRELEHALVYTYRKEGQ